MNDHEAEGGSVFARIGWLALATRGIIVGKVPLFSDAQRHNKEEGRHRRFQQLSKSAAPWGNIRLCCEINCSEKRVRSVLLLSNFRKKKRNAPWLEI